VSVVIDTNVISVSDGHADQAGPDCVVRCVRALEHARAGIVSLDSRREIMIEYLSNVSQRPPSGLGAAFVLDLQRNLFNPKRCEQVAITPDPSRGYAEFPDDPQLEGFDRSDRKFVAVAQASAYSPAILNATDTDWWPVGGRSASASHATASLSNSSASTSCPRPGGRDAALDPPEAEWSRGVAKGLLATLSSPSSSAGPLITMNQPPSCRPRANRDHCASAASARFGGSMPPDETRPSN